MLNLTAEQHRKRLVNLNEAHEKVKKYNKKLRINNYIPGQVNYHIGEYPNKFSISPTEYDEKHLKDLKERGFELVQIHSEWMDKLRLYGGSEYVSHDDEGLKELVKLCQSNGQKVLGYCSTAFLDAKSPDFKECFKRKNVFLQGGPMNLHVCWHGSPEWREYIWEKTFSVLERYNFDGIYNDMGHDAFLEKYLKEIEETGTFSGNSSIEYEADIEDILSMFYNEMKRRGKIYKLHIGTYLAPVTDEKVYDYLWVGEGAKKVTDIIKYGRDMMPYVVPAFDRRTTPIEDFDLMYACTIPFVQFPMLYRGRPITQYEKVSGVEYFDSQEFDGKLMGFDERAAKHYAAHPNEPTFSEWSNIPDEADELDRATKYLKLYKPMVEEGSVARVEIREAEFIKSPIPEKVYISLFSNEEQYLVITNLTEKPYELVLDGTWINRETNDEGKIFTVPHGKLLFLRLKR